MEYKSKWNGRNYIKIDTFYASSQLCFSCGYKNINVKDLKVRDWICPFCNTKHDRDINAAKKYIGRRIKTSSIRKTIGQGLPELTPVEIVGCEVSEAGSP